MCIKHLKLQTILPCMVVSGTESQSSGTPSSMSYICSSNSCPPSAKYICKEVDHVDHMFGTSNNSSTGQWVGYEPIPTDVSQTVTRKAQEQTLMHMTNV